MRSEELCLGVVRPFVRACVCTYVRGRKRSPTALYTVDLYTVRQKKRNHFSFVNKSFNTQCNLTKFSRLLLLLLNIIIDITNLISGTYTDFADYYVQKV